MFWSCMSLLATSRCRLGIDTSSERRTIASTMEVDQEKETDDGVAEEISIDDLPNELLLMIFRNLSYYQLLRASATNHRWNELAFFLLQNRVSLRLSPWALETCREWTCNRVYSAVSFRSDLYESLNLFALYPLAENVRKLELTSYDAADGCLLDFLRPFEQVETLEVKVDRLRLFKTPAAFLRKSSGLLPSVRHLTLRCRYVRIAGLLLAVAPSLVTLDVELVARLLPNFYECRFECLQSLTLRFKLAKVVHTWFIRGKQELGQYLRQVTSLRKFGLFVDSDAAAYEVAFALPSIEELTLGGRFKRFRHADLANLSQMRNLRSLIFDFEAEHFGMYYGFPVDPVPTVETFRTNKPTEIPLSVVIPKFPYLKELSIAMQVISDYEVQAIVGSTWQCTMEDLTLEIASIKPSVIASFAFLQKLKKLCLFCRDDAKDGLSQFNAIVAMDTMKVLHIRRLYGMQWWPSAAELADCNASCAVFINEMPAKFYGRKLQ